MIQGGGGYIMAVANQTHTGIDQQQALCASLGVNLGGFQQRVSIARALAKRPKLLLCDEPTGALDYNTGRQILKLLQETCRKDKMTVVLITHNGAITPMADHIIRMKSGKIVEDIYNENPKNVEEIEW